MCAHPVLDVAMCFMLWQGVAARQRSRYLRFARPPQEKELIRSRNKTIKGEESLLFAEVSDSLIVVGD